MSLIIPDWVAHISVDNDDKDKKKQTTIFSLSVHPDGSRLATGGIDQKIRIWTTEPILDAAAESIPGTHKLLSTLSRHTGSVVSVRFSPSGRYLASGSDDQVCFIWEYDPHGTSMGSFGSSEQNVESWKIHRRLTGHESDVVDIAWSADPDDSYLATVGLDAVINIWSGPSQDGSRGGFERVRRIAGHDGFVKGVVWDPRGNYLATQSDDKTLKIWRTSDWSCAKVVTEPFQHSPSSNFFGRPSWSPDGGYIIAANAMSGPVFVASVIERKTWATDLKLVGHEDSVVVCAFSPRLFKLHGSRPDSAPATIVAIGSRDQSISIWITGIDKPLLVLKDVFDRQVTDLAWASDGVTLYASSTAGSVAAIVLDPADVAEPLPLSRSYHQRPNIQTMLRAGSLAPQNMGGTLQRPNVLQPRKAGSSIQPARASIQPARAIPSASGGPSLPPPANAKAGAQRLDQQIQILANGKRRIKPTLIGDESGAAYSAPPTSSSNIVTADTRMDLDIPGPSATSVVMPSQQTFSSVFVPQQQQLPQQTPQQQLQQHQQFQQYQQFLQFQQLQQQQGSLAAFSDTPMPTTYQSDQSFDAALAASRVAKGRGKEGRILGSDLPRETMSSGALIRPGEDGDFFSKGLPKALSLPPVMGTLRREGEGGGVVEVRNYDGSRPAELIVYDAEATSGKVQWMDFLSTFVLRCALSIAYVTVAQSDGHILIYTSKGRRVGTIALDSPVCLMECRGAVLMVITSAGCLHRWNLQEDRELHRPISCLSLLAGPDDVHNIILHSNGSPVMILKTEQAWTIDPNKNSWTLIASGWFADCSPLWDGRSRGRGGAGSSGSSGSANGDLTSSGGFNVADSGGRWREPVKAIESEINSLVVARGETGVKPAVKPPSEDAARAKDFTLATSLRHLEMRMQAAILLSSKDEYQLHLRAYARLIADEGLKGLGEELIREFLGPIYYTPSEGKERQKWESTIFDIPKRTICRELLGIMGKSRVLGGMATTYLELLKNMG